MATNAKEFHPTRFGFFLLDNFTLISMASAIEPLRLANRCIRRQHFEWRMVSETGAPVLASGGLSIGVDCSIEASDTIDTLNPIIVCGGARIEEHTPDSVLKWLKSLAQAGVSLGATCTGSHALAAAGLLDGYRCSVHWENIASLADRHPEAQVTKSVYTIDRDRFTCSGGTAPIDMMLYFIRKQLGPDVSADVTEQLIYAQVRRSGDQQRVPLRHVVGGQSEKLVVAVDLMEANIKEPIDQGELATYVGLSRRQLQRLFDRYLHCTPSRYYLQIRLTRARELLRQTGMSLVEISSLTGFVSTSHFSKTYKEFYGYPPSSERRRG